MTFIPAFYSSDDSWKVLDENVRILTAFIKATQIKSDEFDSQSIAVKHTSGVKPGILSEVLWLAEVCGRSPNRRKPFEIWETKTL